MLHLYVRKITKIIVVMAVQDIFFIGTMFFVVVIAAVLVASVWFGINTELDTALNNVDSTAVIRDVGSSFNALDWTFFTLAVGLPLVSAILAYFVPLPPLFLFFGIVIVAIFMIIFPQFANVFVSIVTESDISSTADIENRWAMTTFIMQNFPLYMLAGSAIILIALFAKPSRD